MANSLKHELRTPLNHIIGYCELLLEEQEERGLASLAPDLQRIHSAGKRLLVVVNDLFDENKGPALRADRSLVHHEVRTPLNQILGYVEMLQEETAEPARPDLVADLGRIDSAARELLRLVLLHLLDEATASALTEVAAPRSTTTFLRRETLTASARSQDGEPAAAILLVDDDPGNRDMLSRRLRRLGYAVTTAANGREALELLQRQRVDLMLLDIQMPEMNGYQVLEHIKADPARQLLPVVVLSASDDTERIAHCIQLGAEDYLPKPFDPIVLQARLSACLEKKQLRDREQLHLRQIQAEREKSDRLLLNVLPAPIADRLKEGEETIADSFEEASVLFADLVGFTPMAASLPPAALVNRLNEIFSAFDQAAAGLELEKIKTIGDAYMAVGGLPVRRLDHVQAVAQLALGMQEQVRLFNARSGAGIQIRIGIHAGPVVAGVIGRHKFTYDLWGDTVNLASRMESNSLPDRIQVTAAVADRLRNDGRFRIEPRGPVEIKGRGVLETFWLSAARGTSP